MNRVCVLVEGDTEASFVDSILSPEFMSKNILLYPLLFRRQGGSFRYEKCRKVILSELKQGKSAYITTMVDFYGMPTDWPGRTESKSSRNYQDKAKKVEQALSEDIVVQMGESWNPTQFIPYVQMHEFEALLFSDTSILAANDLKISKQLDNILQSFSCPEEINDNYATCSSRQIKQHMTDYNKKVDGILAAQKIGLSTMRRECPHFNEWITRLENLGD